MALITKHLDALLKTFATSGAIVVTGVAGHVLLDDPLIIPIAIGADCTVLSLMNYNEGEARPACEKCELREREEGVAWPRSPYNYLPAPKVGGSPGHYGAEADDDKPLIDRAVPR